MSNLSAVTDPISPRSALEPTIADPTKHCQFDPWCQFDNKVVTNQH